jgi:hypothetical protein
MYVQWEPSDSVWTDIQNEANSRYYTILRTHQKKTTSNEMLVINELDQ